MSWQASILWLSLLRKSIHSIDAQYPICICVLVINSDSIALSIEMGDVARPQGSGKVDGGEKKGVHGSLRVVGTGRAWWAINDPCLLDRGASNVDARRRSDQCLADCFARLLSVLLALQNQANNCLG